MENYTKAELEIVALATGDVNVASDVIAPGENELPLDPGTSGKTYTT